MKPRLAGFFVGGYFGCPLAEAEQPAPMKIGGKGYCYE